MPLACAFADIVARDLQRLEAEGTPWRLQSPLLA
jgi:hypothetical protein